MWGIQDLVHLGGCPLVDRGLDCFGQVEGHVSLFGFTDLPPHLFLDIDQGLDGLVTKVQGFHHHVFGDLLCTAFDHQDGITRAGDTQVER